jgi:uncharacterized protein YcbX
MALIDIEIQEDYLILTGLNKSEKLKVPIEPSKTKKNCRFFLSSELYDLTTTYKIIYIIKRVWSTRIDGYVYDEETGIAKWLSDYLEKDNLNLICFDIDLDPRKVKDNNEQSCNATEDDIVIYADYSPFMLISESSIVDLNSKLNNAVNFKNFRPNIVAKDCDAFAEVC